VSLKKFHRRLCSQRVAQLTWKLIRWLSETEAHVVR